MQSCALDEHKIEDEYVEICEKWEYWNPHHPWRDEDSVFGKSCRNCKYYVYRKE